MIHELRAGELAALDATPLTRYYGTVDATPLFLCLLAEHAQWSGSLELFHELREAVEAALGWIDDYGDHDGDGLLDYRASQPDGLRNQGWRDSDDGVLDEHGVPLEPPIALIEPQAYAARAKRDLARLFAHAGEHERARALAAEAAALERAARALLAPGPAFLLARPRRRRSRERARSPPTRATRCGPRRVSPERAQAVRNALMGEELFSGWGIRTLGRHENGFNPVGYHLGTVWPHDTALCAAGLRHYGYDEDFVTIFEALLEAASHADDYRLPELFAGFSRTEFETPVPYPVACHPQAWAAGAIPYLLTSGLGLHAAGLEPTLRIRRPSLPRWVNRVEVKRTARRRRARGPALRARRTRGSRSPTRTSTAISTSSSRSRPTGRPPLSAHSNCASRLAKSTCSHSSSTIAVEPVDVGPGHEHLATGRRDARVHAGVPADGRPAGGHPVGLGDLVVDRDLSSPNAESSIRTPSK